MYIFNGNNLLIYFFNILLNQIVCMVIFCFVCHFLQCKRKKHLLVRNKLAKENDVVLLKLPIYNPYITHITYITQMGSIWSQRWKRQLGKVLSIMVPIILFGFNVRWMILSLIRQLSYTYLVFIWVPHICFLSWNWISHIIREYCRLPSKSWVLSYS